MASLRLRMVADEGTRFAEESAGTLRGQSFLARVGETPVGVGVVADAWVVDDGEAILLQIEVPDEMAAPAREPQG